MAVVSDADIAAMLDECGSAITVGAVATKGIVAIAGRLVGHQGIQPHQFVGQEVTISVRASLFSTDLTGVTVTCGSNSYVIRSAMPTHKGCILQLNCAVVT